MKKYLLTICLVSFVLAGLFAISGSYNCADAKTYNLGDACPADTSKKVSDFYTSAISSMDIHVVVLGTNVPNGTKFNITAKAAACTEVKCLLREESKTTQPYTQGAVLLETLNKMGCGGAGSGCNDTATVSVTSTPPLSGCTWSYSDTGAITSFTSNNGSKAVTLANGTEKSMYFMLTCTPSNPPVCASLTMDARAGSGGKSVQGTISAGQSVNLFANIVDDDGDHTTSAWNSSCGTFSSKNWDYATWKAPSTPGTCFITYSLNGDNQPSCNGSFTISSPTKSPTPTPPTTCADTGETCSNTVNCCVPTDACLGAAPKKCYPVSTSTPTIPIGGTSSTPTTSPTITMSPTPTLPTSTITPGVTEPICPVPATPVVRVKCPSCTQTN